MNRSGLLIALSILIIGACSLQAPLPTDHYYRLPELTEVPTESQLFEAISVLTFQTDGLHKERALLYTAEGVELKQYHYHFWVDSPQRLLQQRLIERLQKTNIAKSVLMTYEGYSELIVTGQIKAFERIKNNNEDSVKVNLILRVDPEDGGLPLLQQEYQQIVAVAEPNVLNVVNGFNNALNEIYARFIDDLKAAVVVL